MKFLKELGIPFLAFIVFFIIQSLGWASEGVLTFLIISATILTTVVSYNEKELLLFIIGCALGLIIEIGLRYLGHQQTWINASLFGVPYWLPLAWGFGFVIITRLGIFIRTK